MNNEIFAGIKIVLGDKPDGYYFASLFFSILGIIISLYHGARKKYKAAEGTPSKFSWLFLVWDNLIRCLVTLVVMFIVFRVWDVTSIWLMIGVGIGVSFSLDKIIKLMMDKWDWVCKVLSQDRSKFPQLPNQQNEGN